MLRWAAGLYPGSIFFSLLEADFHADSVNLPGEEEAILVEVKVLHQRQVHVVR